MSDSQNVSQRSIGEIDGAILSMNIRNFFCHESLEIKFNKNINFIVGRNGSGKSAILTALVVGLGGRAALTNRGTSLHSFIKKGTNSASIEIKIKNNSTYAYRHDVYGDIITIIRTLNASGGSSYKIKNESGHTVSTKYDDVSMICSVLDIQVDNPICVLNQDDARNFHASDPKKKYLLYCKATNMDVVEANYKKALNNCAQAKLSLAKKKQAFSELEKDLQQLKAKYDEMKSRDEVKENLRSLENEFHWSKIADLENAVKQTLKHCDRQKVKVSHLDKQLKELSVLDANYENNVSNMKDKLKEVAIVNVNREAEFKAMSATLHELRVQWKACLMELKKNKEKMSREEAQVQDLTKEVNAATNIDQAQDKLAKLSDLKKKLHELEARQQITEHDLNQTQSAINHDQTILNTATKRKENLQNSLRHIKSQLNELNVRGKDNLAVYGKNMTDLVAAVKRAHSQGLFSEMPRGPVGSYLKVRDKKWTSALEHIIGGSLKTFCVNNDQDSRKLFSIMQQVYGNEPKPTITTSKFYHNVHNVSAKCVRASNGLQSALGCLQVDDPVIANFLIDNIRMESILMVPTHDEAISLSAEESRVPINCSKIVTLDQTEFYPAPNYRSYGGAGKPSRYLQISTNERKMQLQNEQKKLEMDLSKMEMEYKTLKDDSSKLDKHEKELDSYLQKILQRRQVLQGNISNLESNLREMEGAHIKVLTEELNLAKERLSVFQIEQSKLTEKEVEYKSKTKDVESKVNVLRHEKDNQNMALNDNLHQEQLKLDRNKSEIEMINQALRDEQRKLAEFNKKYEAEIADINEQIQSAENLCPRVENTRPSNVIVTELRKVKSKLDSMKRSGPSKQQVCDTIIERENAHKTTSDTIMKLSLLVEKLKKTASDHLQSAIHLQSFIGNRVQYSFQWILKYRGYLGSMEIDTQKGILDIKCTGRDSATVRTASSTRSLSGGERSYATVAFIMALWDCMELPFYFLDEFDVFMDNVNRKTTMELLIGHAKLNPNRQYVFLTPQDTSILVPTDEIRIHRLADPVREAMSQA